MDRQHCRSETAPSGGGSMRRRVVPPSNLPEDVLNDEEFDLEIFYTGATDSMYYTNLLVNDVVPDESVHAAPTATSDPTIQITTRTSKSSQGRTKNFSQEEDALLISAWLNVGLDPIRGVDQSHGTLWKRIHEYFHAHKQIESTRNEGSLSSRWSNIQADVNVFCGCVAKIEQRNSSGTRVDDKLGAACTLFKAEKNKKFNLMHAWTALKDQAKWIDMRKEIEIEKSESNKKQKKVADSSPASSALQDASGGADVVEQTRRPDGRKKEKQKLRQGRTIDTVDYLLAKMKEADQEKELKKEERCNKAFALQEEKTKLRRERFEFQKQQAEKAEEERILGLDLSKMSYKQQQYYEGRQNEILGRCS